MTNYSLSINNRKYLVVQVEDGILVGRYEQKKFNLIAHFKVKHYNQSAY
jgi:hypothetical protein